MKNLILNHTLATAPWLHSILNNVPDAVMIADPDFLVMKWNEASEQLLNKKKGETLAGKNLIELLQQLGSSNSGINQRLQHIIANGSYEEDILLVRPGGEILKLSCYTHKLPGTEKLSAIVVVIHDLQHQIQKAQSKKTECNANLDESVYYSYLDNSLAPAWIADEDGQVLFMNKLARQIWHLDETYRFKHAYELFPKEVADEFLASDRAVLNTGLPIDFVIPSIRKDGSPGFYKLHKFLLPLNTEKRLVVGQAVDITEEITMREELRKSNERFSYVAKAVADCIWDWDMETGKIYRSEALMALTGYTAQDIEGTLDWWMGKIHPKDRKLKKDKLDAFLKQGHPYCDIEYRFRCAGNRYKYFLDKGYIVYTDGKPVRAIGVVHDITEMKKMEAKLVQQKIKKQQEISQAVIATQDHICNELGKELHDNVNQILASADILLEYVRKDECGNREDCLKKSQQYVHLAVEEIRKISKTLNTSRIKEVGLIKPVEEIIATIELNRLTEVKFEYDPEVEQQLSDEQKLMLYRIIQEQTNNITKYAEASKVLIAVKRKINSIHLVIQDNGKGFDLKQVKRGIGLANIRNRAETFNGSLNITTTPGKGCSIEVMIPLREAK